jgi:hypothetical protein
MREMTMTRGGRAGRVALVRLEAVRGWLRRRRTGSRTTAIWHEGPPLSVPECRAFLRDLDSAQDLVGTLETERRHTS